MIHDPTKHSQKTFRMWCNKLIGSWVVMLDEKYPRMQEMSLSPLHECWEEQYQHSLPWGPLNLIATKAYLKEGSQWTFIHPTVSIYLFTFIQMYLEFVQYQYIFLFICIHMYFKYRPVVQCTSYLYLYKPFASPSIEKATWSPLGREGIVIYTFHSSNIKSPNIVCSPEGGFLKF